MVKINLKGWRSLLSPVAAKVIKILPESVTMSIGRRLVNNYLKKYADITVNGLENIDKVEKPRIFVCNHLSNSDGLVLAKVLKEKSDPYFIAGVKLGDDPITKVGRDLVKNIPIHPNSPDKDAMTKIVKTLKSGEDILIFPEGTRSRSGGLIEGKKGILLFARMAKANIIPIGMSGTDKLLPIAQDGNMGGEEWHESKVEINIGGQVVFPEKVKGENRHDYEDKCMDTLMRSIAALLPESYRGIYK